MNQFDNNANDDFFIGGSEFRDQLIGAYLDSVSKSEGDRACLLAKINEIQGARHDRLVLELALSVAEVRLEHARELMLALAKGVDNLRDIDDLRIKLLEHGSAIQSGMIRYLEEKPKKIARKGADALHSKAGGSREKAQKIREMWETGKYSTRDRCAEEECGALGMSFSTARKALRNTPDPS